MKGGQLVDLINQKRAGKRRSAAARVNRPLSEMGHGNGGSGKSAFV